MKRNTVFTATLQAAKTHRWLSLGTALCALSSVAVSLLPPLVLGHLIDRLTIGLPFPFYLALVYFGSLVLEGVLTAAQETTLELFGQKMTHALRTEMSKKLTHLPAATLAAQEPALWPPGLTEMWTRWRRCSPPVSSPWRRTAAGLSPSSQ